MPYEPPPELAGLSLTEIADLVSARKLPPVADWAPAEVGESYMVIQPDGRWFHEGGEITRPAMVRAFSSLLLRDATGVHWLVTPTQKLRIDVVDAPFIAVDVVRKTNSLAFRLNTDDIVIAGPDHPLRAMGDPDTPALYLAVRNGCEARLNRSTYLQLAEIALEDGSLSVMSEGMAFPLVPA